MRSALAEMSSWKLLLLSARLMPAGTGRRRLVLRWPDHHFLSTSAPARKSNPEWVAARDAERRRRDARWRERRGANPFARNVGLANRLWALRVDPDDPAFADPDPPAGGGVVDPGLHAEALADDTERARRNLHGDGRRRMGKGTGMSSYAIMMKKRFSPPKDPNLLTWGELRTVAHLHQADPATWTVERLAEGFPATPDTVRRLARKKYEEGVSEGVIQDLDEKARENWRKLAKGKLEISEELEAHLREIKVTPKDRLKQLEAGQRKQLELDLLEENRRLLEGPKMRCGEFGEIIRSYKTKVEAKRRLALQKQEEEEEEKGVPLPSPRVEERVLVEATDVFDPQTEFNPTARNVPSPYRDTALLNVADGGFRDDPMTAQEFRSKRLRGQKFTNFLPDDGGAAAGRGSALRGRYQAWLEEELERERAVTKGAGKLSADDLCREEGGGGGGGEGSHQGAEEAGMLPEPVKKYREKGDPVETPVTLAAGGSSDAGSSEKIEIPPEKYVKGAIYELNETFYDEDGNFLYRVPVETMCHEKKGAF